MSAVSVLGRLSDVALLILGVWLAVDYGRSVNRQRLVSPLRPMYMAVSLALTALTRMLFW